MIDEKMLIEELQKYFINNSIHKNDLAEVIVKLPKVDGWIPCSERLPDKEEVLNVFVTYYDSETGGAFVDVEGWFRGIWMNTLKWYENRIAWMPLPQPYKEKE